MSFFETRIQINETVRRFMLEFFHNNEKFRHIYDLQHFSNQWSERNLIETDILFFQRLDTGLSLIYFMLFEVIVVLNVLCKKNSSGFC